MNVNKQVSVQSTLLWASIALIVATGLIHLLEAPEDFEEAAYKGILFFLNAATAFAAAYGIYRHRVWGWWLGAAVAAGSILMYIVSRTIGLPSLPAADESWFEPMGVFSVITEAGFLAITGSTVIFPGQKRLQAVTR